MRIQSVDCVSRLYQLRKRMSKADILDKVQKIVAEQLGVEASEVTPQASFAND